MGRSRSLLVLLAVASALPGTSLVRGQAPKATSAPAAKPKEAPPREPKAKDQAKGQPAATAKTKVEAGKAPAKAAVIRPARVAPAALIEAQAAQYLQQFRPLARGEYYFIRNLCGLRGEQRKQLAEAAEQAARSAARKFVEAQQNMMRAPRPARTYPDPRRLIEDEMVARVGFLSSEQRGRYEVERALRAAGRRQVFIDNLVAKLDADLVLTARQREQLSDALAKNWDEAWGQSLDMLMNLDHFFPEIPDAVVTPFLTDKQKAAWRRSPRARGVFFGFGGGMMTWDPDPLDDPELAAARKAAEAKEKK